MPLTLDQRRDRLRNRLGELEAWRLRGVGPAYVRVGGLRRYRRGDLDAWVAAHVHETADSGGAA